MNNSNPYLKMSKEEFINHLREIGLGWEENGDGSIIYEEKYTFTSPLCTHFHDVNSNETAYRCEKSPLFAA